MFKVCENDEVSLCCEEAQFCMTSKGNLICVTPIASAVSDTQTSTTGSSPPSSFIPSSGGGAESNKIALGVGIGVGLPGTVAGILGAYHTYRAVKLHYR